MKKRVDSKVRELYEIVSKRQREEDLKRRQQLSTKRLSPSSSLKKQLAMQAAAGVKPLQLIAMKAQAQGQESNSGTTREHTSLQPPNSSRLERIPLPQNAVVLARKKLQLSMGGSSGIDVGRYKGDAKNFVDYRLGQHIKSIKHKLGLEKKDSGYKQLLREANSIS